MKDMRIHLIGIGGIGMSALARFYLAQKYRVSGSDVARSEITDALEREGAYVAIGPHRTRNLPARPAKIDAVIFTAATDKKNPELREARARKIKTKSYAQALGELTKKYTTIAVAGTHGKSTTASMIAIMMTHAGLDPTVIIGTKLKEFGNSNFRAGASPYLVIEADEYAGSFWQYHPDIAVVTNIDADHLDFYKTMQGVARSFEKFVRNAAAKKIAQGGIVLNKDDKRLVAFAKSAFLKTSKKNICWFSRRDPEMRETQKILQVFGEHNRMNALAAYRVGQMLGIPHKIILEGLARYRGAWRRFEYRGEFDGAKIFDDYAHNPAKVRAALLGAREQFPKKQIWCVFQPHQLARTALLFNEFVKSFDSAHCVVLLDIYEVAGRELKKKVAQKINPYTFLRGIKPRRKDFYDAHLSLRQERKVFREGVGINSFALAQAIAQRNKTSAYYLPYHSQLRDFLKDSVGERDIVIMMGAGDIWKLTGQLV